VPAFIAHKKLNRISLEIHRTIFIKYQLVIIIQLIYLINVF
jgi:hypothetical protein